MSQIQQHLDHISFPSNMNTMHDFMIDALNKGKKQIPPMTNTRNQTVPWTSDSTLTDLHQKRVMLRKQKDNETIRQKIKNVTTDIKTRVKEIQNIIFKKKAMELNDAKQHRNIVKLWRNAKSHGCSAFRKSSPLQCPGLD